MIARPKHISVDPEATAIFVFVAAGEKIFSRLIRRVTGPWSHMGIGFATSDARLIYFEALFGRGFRGPRPLEDLIAWQGGRSDRRFRIEWVHSLEGLAHLKYVIAKTYVGKAGYGELQLLAMWFFERIGRRLGWHVPRSPGQVTCSEAVARILYRDLDLRDPDHPRFDEVTPTSAWNRLLARTAKSPCTASEGGGGTHPLPQGGSPECNSVPQFCKGTPGKACSCQTCHGVLLANARRPDPLEDDPDAEEILGLPNAFEVLQDNWLCIPYGDQEYHLEDVSCIQRLTRQAAERLVNCFRSWRGKLTRRFGGLPFYVGHPDHPAFANTHKDTRSYGWIMDLAARPEGLGLFVKWSEAGRELIANAHYKFFSPNWWARKIGRENGRDVVEPVWIKSCGFTNNPRWPVFPLANQDNGGAAARTQETNMELLQRLIAILGLEGGDATEEGVVTAITRLREAAQKIKEALDARWQAEDAAREALPSEMPLEQQTVQVLGLLDESATALANERTAREQAAGQVQTLQQQLTAEQAAHTQADEAFKGERRARAELLVNEAVAGGRVLPADRDRWIEELVGDFDSKSVELANEKGALKTRSATGDLGERNGAAQGATTNSQRIVELVNEKLDPARKGHDYTECYLAVKREHPELFAPTSE